MSNKFVLPHFSGKLMSTQVSSLLIKELLTGAFSEVKRLPSEVDLSDSLGVSRTVIRDALSDLEREGLIERIRGIGTVVNRDIVNLKNRLDLKFEYNDLILNAGHKPSADSIMVRIEKPNEDMAKVLQVDITSDVIVCEKRVLANNVPVIYSIDYLPLYIFGDTNHIDIDWSTSIFDILDRHCGLSVVTDIAKVSATNSNPVIRKKLNVPDDEALMFLDEIGYCKLSRPIMRSFEYYTSFFDFTILRKKF